jgi:hypothetical protein
MAVMTAPPRRRPHEVRIDSVDLPPGTVGTRRVRAAIERELARLLAAAPAGYDAELPAAIVEVAAGADADAIGVDVAKHVHARLTKGGPVA